MTRNHSLVRLLLAALLALQLMGLTLLAAGCSSNPAKGPEAVASQLDAMRSAVTKEVADPKRQSALLQSIDGLQSDLESLDRLDFETMTRIRALNTRADVTRAEMETVLDSLDQQRRLARDRVVQRHFEMTSQTTAEEWEALGKLERKALLAAVR